MIDLLNNVFSVLQITLIDIVLSSDNMGAIALAVRRLPKNQARIARIVGVAAAVLLRIFFASIITTLLTVEWIPVKLVGGILLLSITWDILNIQDNNTHTIDKTSKSFWRAVFDIIIADISVSLDNVIAIGGVAKGNVFLLVFGLVLNIPILFFGSRVIVSLIEKCKITVFIGASFLVHTAIEMVLEDRMIAPYVSQLLTEAISWIGGLMIIFYGIYMIRRGIDWRYKDR